jgi:HEAT repeat protein
MKSSAGGIIAKGLVACLGILAVGVVVYLMPLGRELMVRLLGKMGPVATPLLRRALQDDNHMVQWAARDALLELGVGAVPSLLRGLADKDARIRAEAADALSLLGPTAKDGAPTVIAAFHDPDNAVRVKAMMAFRYVGDHPIEQLPILLEIACNDANGHVRAAAIETVGVFGHLDIQLVTPAFLRALKDGDAEVRAEAAEALGKLARRRVMPEEAVAPLKEALKDPDQNVRGEAAEALSMISAGQGSPADKE